MPARPIIEVRSCRFRYKDASEDTVHIDNLTLQPSQHLFIHGKSGSGKSTFLNLLCGVLESDAGTINILSTPFSSMSSAIKDRIRADHYGIIFQQFNLLAHLSVKENIVLGCSFSEKKKARVSDMDATIKELSEKLDLP
ncbi:MAG: ATP-binding cassette domain-containing protein, partial [Thiovulaceae bacterium]|nr:ATP-binding cassette domain-containing protein [Sulfurimonadaceae bacterium]